MHRVVTLDRPGRLSNGCRATGEEPAAGHAIVQVHRVGLCGTDFHAYHGEQPFFSYPRILGHELGVEVVAVHGSVQGLAPGDRCTVRPYLSCGRCYPCRTHRPNCCTMLQVLGVHCDGGLQERFEVPVVQLHRSAALTFDELALVEPLSIGAHAVRRAQIVPDDRVLVMGAGPIGLATMVAARVSGGRVWAMDVDEHRLQFCADRVPLDRAIVVRGHPVQAFRGVAEDEWPSIVFDATGSAASMTQAFNLVPPAPSVCYNR